MHLCLEKLYNAFTTLVEIPELENPIIKLSSGLIFNLLKYIVDQKSNQFSCFFSLIIELARIPDPGAIATLSVSLDMSIAA